MTLSKTEINCVLSVDHASLAAPLVDALRQQDEPVSIEIRTVKGARDALRATTSLPNAVLVIDFDLSGVEGLRLLRAVRYRSPDLPVVALTGPNGATFAEEARSHGVEDLLPKRDVSGLLLARALIHAVERRNMANEIADLREGIRKAEERLGDFSRAASEWFWEMGPDLRMTWASKQWETVTKTPLSRVIGKTRQELGAAKPDDPAWAEHAADLAAHRPFKDFRYQLRIGEAEPKWLRIDGVPFFDEAGKFLGYRGTGTDISAQIYAERNVARHEWMLKDAIEAFADGFAIFDSDDRLVLCNERYREALKPVADILQPGVPWVVLICALVERGQMILPEGQNGEDWLFEQIVMHERKNAVRVHQAPDGRWIEIREYRTHDGGTVIIRVDVTERKRHETALRKLSQAVEQSPSSVVITDLTGAIEYVNPTFEALTGYAKSEVVGQNPRILRSGETPDEVYESLWKTIRQGNVWHGEMHNRRRNGESFWEYARIGPIKAADGAITHFLAVKEDITDRKQAEEQLALRFSEMETIGAILGAAVNSASIEEISLEDILGHALGILQSAGTVWSRTQARIYLLDEAEQVLTLAAEAGSGILEPETRTTIPLGQRLCIRTVDANATCCARPARDENFSDHYCCSLPLISGGSNLGVLTVAGVEGWTITQAETRFLATLADTLAGVIRQRWADMALRDSETRFRSIARAANEGIVTVDECGLVTSWNAAAERMFGYAETEILGTDVSRIMPQTQSRPFSTLLDEGAGGTTFELTALRQDGNELPLEISLSSWVAGGVRHFTLFCRDMSDRRNLEARLAQAQKMEAVGQLTGGVAHDFNNLLTVIVGNLGLVREHVVEERLRKLIDRAYTAGKHGAELVSHLLAFSRSQALRPETLNLNKVVDETAKLLDRTLGETVAIRVDSDEALWPVSCDPVQLRNALVNLSINGRDAMPDGGTLTIATDNASLDEDYAAVRGDITPGDYVRLTVADTGIGMSREIIARVFEPFFTTKEVGKGSGLGLSMVYGFVTQTGGQIEIESEVGVGTTIKLHLPRAAAEEDRPTPGQQASVPVGSGTILVVEDDAGVRATSVAMLEALGYSCMEAQDGHAAMAILGATPEVALLFSDVVMPGGMTGLDLARQAHERWPTLRILLTSGYPRNAMPQSTDFDSGIELLAKPFDSAALARTVGGLLRDHHGSASTAAMGLTPPRQTTNADPAVLAGQPHH